ncbi:MFS general substrate transporter [Hypoxylon sp. FL0890]|nr:MFS general substrate transporter [Hypoxylon sp. FL0890]
MPTAAAENVSNPIDITMILERWNLHDDGNEYPSALTLYLVILSLFLVAFLVALNQAVICLALGAITGEYGSVKDISWYEISYFLTSTSLQHLYDKVYRFIDIKFAFLGAVAIFEVGSLVPAAASSSTVFIIGRAVAGMGSAGLFSGSIVMLSYTLPLRRCLLMFGMFGCMWGIAWCFYVNLPIGGVAMLVVFFFLNIARVNNPDNQSLFTRILKLDLVEAAVLIPAIILFHLALQWGAIHYQQDKGLLPPRFFNDHNLLCAMLVKYRIYLLQPYFQAIQGDIAVEAGIKLLPLLICLIISSIVSGALITATGSYNPFILTEIAMIAVSASLIKTLDLHTPFARWFRFHVIDGLGVGVEFQAGVIVVQNVVSKDLVPQATSCVQFFQNLDGALFISIVQTVFQNGLTKDFTQNAPHLDPELFIHSGASQVRQALVSTCYVLTATTTVAFLAALGLQWKKIEKGNGPAEMYGRYVNKAACTPAPEFDTVFEGAAGVAGRRQNCRIFYVGNLGGYCSC